MSVFYFYGPDAGSVRRAVGALAREAGLAQEDVEHWDVAGDAGDALCDSVLTGSLFARARFVVAANGGQLLPANAARLERLPEAVTLVLTAERAPAGALKGALSAEVRSFSAPRSPVDGRRAVVATGRELGVELSGEALDLLASLSVDHWSRVTSALEALADAGMGGEVDALLPLLGSAAPKPRPWDLLEALVAGDVARALSMADELEPIAVVAYLAKRASWALSAAEEGWSSAADVAGGTGCSRGEAATVLRWSGRASVPELAGRVALLADADVATKGPLSREHLRVALGRLAA